jgi:hypothetical protein
MGLTGHFWVPKHCGDHSKGLNWVNARMRFSAFGSKNMTSHGLIQNMLPQSLVSIKSQE